MPITSMSFRRNDTAAVEITALAAGAGPPANTIATRRKLWCTFGGRDNVVVLVGMLTFSCSSYPAPARRGFMGKV